MTTGSSSPCGIFRPRSIATVILASVAIAPLSAAQGSVLVVDDGGPAPFHDIGAALAAASDGDTLLVKGGLYDPFTVDGLAVAIVGEPGEEVNLSTVQILNLAAGQEVLLRNLDIIRANYTTSALEAVDNDGTLWVEDCNVAPFLANQIPIAGGVQAAPAVSLIRSLQVVLVRTSVTGRSGLPGTFAGIGAGHGISAGLDSSLALYDCEVSGGHGLSLGAGYVLAYDSTFVGGQGGDGGEVIDPFPLMCTNGDVGLPVRIFPGSSFQEIVALPRHTSMASPVREGEQVGPAFEHSAGDHMLVLVGLDPAFANIGLPGKLQVDPFTVLDFGFLFGPGPTAFLFTAPELGPGLEAVRVYVQGAAIENGGGITLTSPTVLTILDDGF